MSWGVPTGSRFALGLGPPAARGDLKTIIGRPATVQTARRETSSHWRITVPRRAHLAALNEGHHAARLDFPGRTLLQNIATLLPNRPVPRVNGKSKSREIPGR